MARRNHIVFQNVNPYEAACTSPASRPGGYGSRAPGWLIAIAVLGVAAYCYFTWWQLNSTPGDQAVGRLFLTVIPYLAAWISSLVLLPRWSFFAGLLCVSAQVLVAFIMISTLGATSLVVGLNLAIFMAMVTVTSLCWPYRNASRDCG